MDKQTEKFLHFGPEWMRDVHRFITYKKYGFRETAKYFTMRGIRHWWEDI